MIFQIDFPLHLFITIQTVIIVINHFFILNFQNWLLLSNINIIIQVGCIDMLIHQGLLPINFKQLHSFFLSKMIRTLDSSLPPRVEHRVMNRATCPSAWPMGIVLLILTKSRSSIDFIRSFICLLFTCTLVYFWISLLFVSPSHSIQNCCSYWVDRVNWYWSVYHSVSVHLRTVAHVLSFKDDLSCTFVYCEKMKVLLSCIFFNFIFNFFLFFFLPWD